MNCRVATSGMVVPTATGHLLLRTLRRVFWGGTGAQSGRRFDHLDLERQQWVHFTGSLTPGKPEPPLRTLDVRRATEDFDFSCYVSGRDHRWELEFLKGSNWGFFFLLFLSFLILPPTNHWGRHVWSSVREKEKKKGKMSWDDFYDGDSCSIAATSKCCGTIKREREEFLLTSVF